MRVLRCRPERELVEVRLPDEHVARGLQPAHGRGGALGDVIGEDRRSVGGADARGVEDVLDGEPGAFGRRLRAGDEDRFGGLAGVQA
jgi:hypothetical protein